MRRLRRELFPSRTTALIAALLVATLVVAAARHTGLLPIGLRTAMALYAGAAAAGAGAVALAVHKTQATRRK